MNVDPRENLRDAVAYARAIATGDLDGARALTAGMQNPTSLLPAMATLLAAQVRREVARRAVEDDQVWIELVRVADRLGGDDSPLGPRQHG